ncbi:MAG: hypothetical protein ACLFWL_02750 [Candidatus Brocadiia bacterium]
MNKKGMASNGQIRLLLLIIVGAAVLILAFQNHESVETRFLMFRATMPRFALLLLTAGCGFLGGYLLGSHRRRD